MVLSEALFKGSKKKVSVAAVACLCSFPSLTHHGCVCTVHRTLYREQGESYPSSVTKADLYKTMADRCSAFHALRYPGATEPQLRKGAMEPVVLGVKSLQGGRKHITTARNLEVCVCVCVCSGVCGSHC